MYKNILILLINLYYRNMPKIPLSKSSVVTTVRLPKAILEQVDELIASEKTDYTDRSDLIKCAVRKEIEYQHAKLEGRLIEVRGP